MEQRGDSPLYRVTDADLTKINQICGKIERYPNWRDFVNDSLHLFITLWTDPTKTTEMIARMWKDFTPDMKEHARKTSPEFYDTMERMNSSNISTKPNPPIMEYAEKPVPQNEKIFEEVIKRSTLVYRQKVFQRLKDESEITKAYVSERLHNSEFKKPHDAYPYDGYPLIWSFYSRFFPVKIIVSVLAYMLHESDAISVSFDELRAKSYDIAVYCSYLLRNFEDEHQVPRNKKTSTGLPSPPIMDKESYKDMKKSVASEERFLDQFVGKKKIIKKTGEIFFDGALNAMGLAYFKQDEQGKVKVHLSKKGAQLVILSNPVIDDDNFESSISEDEKDFLLEQIIPTFDLEGILVNRVIKKIRDADNNSEIKNKMVQVKEIDDIFEKEISEWVKKNTEKAKKHNLEKVLSNGKDGVNLLQRSIRVATMGRLAEIKSIKWMIDSEGKSYFMSEKSHQKIAQ